MLKCFQDCDLSTDPLNFCGLVDAVFVEDLQRDFLTNDLVKSQPNLAEGALA
jgi:hypothetical protein